MSSLWTPEGEHRVPRPDAATTPAPPGDPTAPAADAAATSAEEDLAALEREVLSAPAADIVANHCYGLFELAVIHLRAAPPQLDEARLAIDALGAVVEGLGERLGERAKDLTDGLASIRLAYVQISGAAGAGAADTSGGDHGTGAG